MAATDEVPTPRDFTEIARDLLATSSTPAEARARAQKAAVRCLNERTYPRTDDECSRLLGWAAAYAAACTIIDRQ